MKAEAGFIIDKLTNSIEKRTTNESFDTDIVEVTENEIKKVHKIDGWFFNWKKEFKEPDRQIYKLVILEDTTVQGLLCLQPIPDQLFIEMHLIESAPLNKGDEREYLGVAGNMVAFACKMSFDLGFEGFVAFTSKTKLKDHYIKNLGAEVIYGKNRMAISTESAKKLVTSYYKDYFNG